MDPDPSVIKELLTKAIEECNDSSLLTLLYQLITYEE